MGKVSICPLCGKDLSAIKVIDNPDIMHMRMHQRDIQCRMFEFIHGCAYPEPDMLDKVLFTRAEGIKNRALKLIEEIDQYNDAVEEAYRTPRSTSADVERISKKF